MPAITYDRWEVGMDRRKGRGVSDANKMFNMKNAYINTGWVPQKRPALTNVKALDTTPQTVGLVPYSNLLNTFSSTGAASHGAGYQDNKIEYPDLNTYGSAVLDSIVDYEIFNGYMYVVAKFDRTGAGTTFDTYHYYLDASPGYTTYSNGEAGIVAGDIRVPTTPNNFKYEAQGAGTAGTEPTWPTTTGSTISDGAITWKCLPTSYVSDSNCPHSASIQRAASKIFAIDSNTVAYTATGDPTDWTTASDAGFLPTGIQAEGSEVPLALGRYNQLLVVAAIDNIQTWSVDPDPTLMLLDEIVPNIGTVYPRTMDNVSGDVYFLSSMDTGYRSLSTLALTQNLADIDVGGPIDPFIRDEGTPTNEPFSVWYQGGGQYWTFRDSRADIYTFSRTAKVSAWSYYDFPFTINAACELSGVLYLRSGDDVYKVDPDAYQDDYNGGTDIDVEVEMHFQAMKKPGQAKLFIGSDVVCTGTTDICYRYDPDDTTLVTDEISVTGDSRRDGMVPIDMVATEMAPRFKNSANEDWRLDLLNLYYEILTTQ